jgi:ParB/RepB/Spo0J family partition protein
MPLSARAIEIDSKKPCVPVKEIFADREWNCRGLITASDVIELANDVAANGLEQPITVRPLWDNEIIPKKQGFKYFLIAGFRRYSAYRANDAVMIPATVRPDLDSDFACRSLNARENLHRKDLNLWQEAVSVRHYWQANWTREEVANEINKSTGWVQIRYTLLNMPDPIQKAAAQGYIKTTDVLELHKYRENQAELLKIAGLLVDKRKEGDRSGALQVTKKKDKASTKKVRKTREIEELQERLQEIFCERDPDKVITVDEIITAGGNGLHTQVLAWAAGNIDSLTLHTHIRDFASAVGLRYEIPDFESESLASLSRL